MRARRGAGALAIAIIAFASSVAPRASADADEHAQNATGDLQFVNREMGGVQSAVQQAQATQMTVEQRLANGEILYRTKDYNRAIVVFSEIIEQYPNTPSYPDALWLRGETYYAAHQYLSARRDYRALVDQGNDPRFQEYFGKALARLVDVALRLDDPPESLAEIFDKFNQVPPAQVDAGVLYAKGKAYYKKGDYTNAQQAFTSVQNGTPYTHQAHYFLGLIAMKNARASVNPDPTQKGQASANYKAAIQIFGAVKDLPTQNPPTADEQHVIDLSNMAVGRLFYEMEQYQQASEWYSKVGRESPEFDTMLFELAWVYVRLGDAQRAERALEVLAVSDPGSQYIGEGTLLRADLLLRAGAFDLQCSNGHCAPGALQLYESVLAQYQPMLKSVSDFLDPKNNPNGGVAIYYDKLSQQQLDAFDQPGALPPLAIRWAREAEDGPAAFAVIADVNECKTLIRESNALVDRLTALTGAANRVKAFPELLAGEEATLGLINRVSHAREELARGMDDQEPSDLGGQIGTVRDQRRQLMSIIDGLPLDTADFDAREQDGQRQWNVVSQSLSQRSLEVDQLQAIVNGLRRMLREDAQRGVARDPAQTQRLQQELDQNQQQLNQYRDQIADLRKAIELGRAQVGLGDQRFQNDADARERFRDLIEQEVQLAEHGAAGGDAQRFATRADPILAQARQYEDHLKDLFSQFEAQVTARTTELRQKIETERANLVRYQAQLDALDAEARDLVGHVAQRNFGIVQAKLKDIVLKADVGITEQAWEVREEENARVTNLKGERARQQDLLDEELREVRDDGAETQTPPPAGTAPAAPPQQ